MDEKYVAGVLTGVGCTGAVAFIVYGNWPLAIALLGVSALGMLANREATRRDLWLKAISRTRRPKL
ncbi:hypothetical protein BJG93_36565 (plasmid) [Paraburkholderia sprentiae WSM5005]|uniref:Uncharacterized protein n=1 Tax=Paraburkholderia sprentiae WSM5005 TaxID=754502 RepID=A0A8F4KJ85_9BURK|nr:hypothetical protein [Paraburkholderia sprentiae]QXE07361.1 hypothetical protein BJG93_36565 [Paraburkholderia sprentiae WSM5005]